MSLERITAVLFAAFADIEESPSRLWFGYMDILGCAVLAGLNC